MRVLVTGGAGYIGSVAVEALLKAGHSVVVFDNLESGHREAIPEGVPLIEGDLARPEDLRRVFDLGRVDAVMHFAASCLVGESMEVPLKYFRNNVVNGVNLLEAMEEFGTKRIVFSSSAAVYGQPTQTPIEETDPKFPTNPYGESKLTFERIMEWQGTRRSLKHVSLRYFNAAGASTERGEDHDPETHLIPLVLQAALGQRSYVEVYGDDYETSDGSCVRDYVHVEDLASAHLLALEYLDAEAYEQSGYRAFNLGNGSGYSVLEVIAAAQKVVRGRIDHRIVGRRPGDPSTLVASADRAEELLGWRRRYPDIESIVQTAWAWHRGHPVGYQHQSA